MGQTQTIGRHATRITTEDGTTRVRYHDTIVVSFDDDTITLNTGGWRTVTTKTRMNQTANQYDLGFCVYQKDFEWYVQTALGAHHFDGQIITLIRATMKGPIQW